MKEGTGKIHYIGNFRKVLIYVPVDVVIDSNFPFEDKEEVDIVISGSSLVVRKKKKGGK